jgi:hypothetical protein
MPPSRGRGTRHLSAGVDGFAERVTSSLSAKSSQDGCRLRIGIRPFAHGWVGLDVAPQPPGRGSEFVPPSGKRKPLERSCQNPTAMNQKLSPCPTQSVCLRRFKRADERTRTADLISLRVISQVLQGFARACNSRISKPVSLLRFAACCIVLRFRWYQSSINSGVAASRSCLR